MKDKSSRGDAACVALRKNKILKYSHDDFSMRLDDAIDEVMDEFGVNNRKRLLKKSIEENIHQGDILDM